MTSSLVGSEMCIRDRNNQGPQQQDTHVKADTMNKHYNKPCVQISKQGPVSYTHLTLPTICSV
eukprot:10571776-Prorocentrum_lima.AAC.1